MPEATIVILDNSEFSINGDYEPTRWITQIDAAGLLISTKLQQSHENGMGIALSAGKHTQIICTPSNDITKVTSYLYGIKLHGHQQLSVALQTSALALKHRQNPTLSQRIICFVASTIQESAEELKLICKKLKKNGIALDLIALGDLSEKQRELLQTMHETGKSDRQSTLLFMQPQNNLNDMLINSNIIGSAAAAQPGAAQMINEAEDPELMMALQLSLQEEEQRRAAEARNNVPSNEDEELEQRALQLSMEDEKDEKDEKKKEE